MGLGVVRWGGARAVLALTGGNRMVEADWWNRYWWNRAGGMGLVELDWWNQDLVEPVLVEPGWWYWAGGTRSWWNRYWWKQYLVEPVLVERVPGGTGPLP